MSRRLALRLAAIAAAGALIGCAATSTPAPRLPHPAQLAVLKEWGFQPIDEGWLLDLGALVRFEFGSDVIGPGSVTAIERLATALASVGLDRCRVEGHADEIGAEEFNQALSLRRAEAVARVLVAKGLPGSGVSTRGFGKSKPIADNRTDSGRAQNRRVVMIVPAG